MTLNARPQPKRARAIRWTAWAAALTLVVAAGCGPSSSSRSRTGASYTDEVSADGLRKVRASRKDQLWVNPSHQMGRYDEILLTGISLEYDQGEERLPPEEEKRVQEALVAALRGVTKGAPVQFAKAPGPCVVSMSVGLAKLRLHRPQNQGSVSDYVASFGSTAMLFEFRDSMTNQPLIRYATRRELGGGAATGGGADIHRLSKALGEMAGDMTRELQDVVPTASDLDNKGCHGGIRTMAGRD